MGEGTPPLRKVAAGEVSGTFGSATWHKLHCNSCRDPASSQASKNAPFRIKINNQAAPATPQATAQSGQGGTCWAKLSGAGQWRMQFRVRPQPRQFRGKKHHQQHAVISREAHTEQQITCNGVGNLLPPTVKTKTLPWQDHEPASLAGRPERHTHGP